MKRDYYEVLGISRDSGTDEIKRAYRKRALKYHPDKNPGDKKAEEAFKEAAEAYSILIDPEKKSIYDRFGQEGLRGEGFSGFSGFNSSIFEDFGDILGNFFDFGFGGIFGNRARRGVHYPERGRDLNLTVEISLEEAAFGVEKEFKLNRAELCPECYGSKMKPGTQKSTCPHCSGTGQVRYQQGFFTIARTCSHCRGAGEIIGFPCQKCNGIGKTKGKKALNVKIPAGVDTGMKLRIEGEGEAGDRGGERGDLYVAVSVKPHPYFSREADNLFCQVKISFAKATMGIQIEIPTLEGNEILKVPPGTQPGEVFKLKGKGVKSLNSHRRGDLFVKVGVETPKNLSKKQKELVEKFAESMGEDLGKVDKNVITEHKKFH